MQNKTEKPSAGALRANLVEAIKRDILNTGSIYRSVGEALYDQRVNRLAERIASTAERETGAKELINELSSLEKCFPKSGGCSLIFPPKEVSRIRSLLSKHRGEKEIGK